MPAPNVESPYTPKDWHECGTCHVKAHDSDLRQVDAKTYECKNTMRCAKWKRDRDSMLRHEAPLQLQRERDLRPTQAPALAVHERVLGDDFHD